MTPDLSYGREGAGEVYIWANILDRKMGMMLLIKLLLCSFETYRKRCQVTTHTEFVVYLAQIIVTAYQPTTCLFSATL